MTKSKKEQIADLRDERDHIQVEMAALRARLDALERRGTAISSQIAALQMSGSRRGRPTLSRALVRRVWEGIEDMTWNGKGITPHDLYEGLRWRVPGLRRDTLRVYLHRFGKDGLLLKQGSLWHRTAIGARSKPKENRPLPTAGFSGAEAPLVIADTDTLASPSTSVNDPRLGGSFLQAQKEAS